jgi:hypothetical protein
MTTLALRRKQIKKWRTAGRSVKSYEWIAGKLGVSKPEAKRLENPAHVPGLKVQKQLGVTLVCPTCTRKMPVAKKERKTRVIVLSDSQVSMKQHINRVIVSEWHDLDVPDIKKVLLSIVKDLKEIA